MPACTEITVPFDIGQLNSSSKNTEITSYLASHCIRYHNTALAWPALVGVMTSFLRHISFVSVSFCGEFTLGRSRRDEIRNMYLKIALFRSKSSSVTEDVLFSREWQWTVRRRAAFTVSKTPGNILFCSFNNNCVCVAVIRVNPKI